MLSGECLLLIEGEERPLKALGLRALLRRGPSTSSSAPAPAPARSWRSARDWAMTLSTPQSELAQRHGAGVKRETRDPQTAYADLKADATLPYQPGWLPRGLTPSGA